MSVPPERRWPVVCSMDASWECSHAIKKTPPEGYHAFHVDVTETRSYEVVVFAEYEGDATTAAIEATDSPRWEPDYEDVHAVAVQIALEAV